MAYWSLFWHEVMKFGTFPETTEYYATLFNYPSNDDDDDDDDLPKYYYVLRSRALPVFWYLVSHRVNNGVEGY